MFLQCQKASTKWTVRVPGYEEWGTYGNLLTLQRGSKSFPWGKDSPYPKVDVQLVIPADRAGIPSNFIFTL